MYDPRCYKTISQFLEYSHIIAIFPRLEEIIFYNDRNLSFEQFSRILNQYMKENHEKLESLFSMSVSDLYDDLMRWWEKSSENKKNFIISTNIQMNYWIDKRICPRCESGTLKQGKAQKIQKEWERPTICSNKECSLHNNTELDLVL